MTECAAPPKRLRISWSQLQIHEECSHKAKLKRAGVKSPAADVRNFFHGNVCDRVMRAWLANPVPGAMPGMVEEFIESQLKEIKEKEDGVVRWKSTKDRAQMTERCKLLLERLEPMLNKWVLPYDYEPEHRFEIPCRIPYIDGTLAEIELIGGMDILVREAEEPLTWAVYDLKATSSADYLRKTLGQSIFYDLALLAGTGASPVRFGFFQPLVESNPVAMVTISRDERMGLLQRIVKVAHDRWKGEDDEPKESSAGCGHCEVRFACKKYKMGPPNFRPVRG